MQFLIRLRLAIKINDTDLITHHFSASDLTPCSLSWHNVEQNKFKKEEVSSFLKLLDVSLCFNIEKNYKMHLLNCSLS